MRTSRRSFLAGSSALAAGGLVAPAAHAAGAAAREAAGEAGISSAVTLALANLLREGLTDVPWLGSPFEIERLRADRDLRRAVASRATQIIARRRFDAANFSPVEQVTIPKRQYGSTRPAAVMEPMDTLVYLALALLAAPSIEAARTPAEGAAPKHRLMPQRGGLIFDGRNSFVGFGKAALRRGRAAGVTMVCDVAQCFDRMPVARVRHALAQAGVAPWLGDYLGDLLDFWSGGSGVGLPVGSNGSRILAEAVLAQIDRGLRADGIASLRYVDEFWLYAPDQAGAARALAAVEIRLAPEGLALNQAKTARLELAQAKPPSGPPPAPAPTAPRDEEPGLPLPQIPRGFRPLGPPGAPYSDLVPRFARALKPNEIALVRAAGWKPDPAPFLHGKLAPPLALRHAIRYAIYGGSDGFLRALPDLLARYPEFGSYVASSLVKGAACVPAETRRALSARFAVMLGAPATPGYLDLRLTELLAHPDYRARGALEAFGRAAAAAPRGLRFRTALDALRVSGGVPAALHALYDATDAWGRRALLADRAGATPDSGDPFAANLAVTPMKEEI